MKIFWSWQSDTPGKIGRFLIRDALKDAIATLRAEPEIHEPNREDLHIDHDIQGVTGSPNLVPTIFAKIDQSAVVVADVSLVGTTTEQKKLINSNVAIELGYALKAVTDAKVVLVFNRHYGSHEDLPFDLRHKGGAVVFDLPPDAVSTQIRRCQQDLARDFVAKLRPLLETPRAPLKPVQTPSTYSKAAYFSRDQTLASEDIGVGGRADYFYRDESFCYIRLIPSISKSPTPSLSALKEAARSVPLLSGRSGEGYIHNEFGAIAYRPRSSQSGRTIPEASTQLFRNGEIWALNSVLMVRQRGDADHPSYVTYPCLDAVPFEREYYRFLRAINKFAREDLGLAPPFTVELGLTGTQDVSILSKSPEGSGSKNFGPIRQPEIVHRYSIDNDESISRALEAFFNEVWDAAGEKRPASSSNLFLGGPS